MANTPISLLYSPVLNTPGAVTTQSVEQERH